MTSRFDRSDKGIVDLTSSIFTDLLGLSGDTASKLMQIIRSQGQYQDLKQNFRSMSTVAYRRLNDAINLHHQTHDDVEDDFDSDIDGIENISNPVDFESRNAETGVRETFAGFLLRELQYDAEDLRDPQKKQEIMRLMRAGDAQAQQMIQRSEREQKKDTRQEVQQEKDPRKVSLLRKKMNLQKQIQQIDQQLNAATPGTSETV